MDYAVGPTIAPRGGLDRARWYFNRLRCMGPAEIPHRLARALATQLEHVAPRDRDVPLPDLGSAERPWLEPRPTVDPDAYLAAANRVIAGQLDVYGLCGAAVDTPPRWNRDPRTGVEAPLTFGKLLNYRDPRLVGDVRCLWELNRHSHLVTLAQAFALSGDEKYVATLKTHLDSWIAACPFRLGPNWANALEPAIRLINWAVAWQLLGGLHAPCFAGSDGAAFRQRWLESIHRHATFVRGFFSLHSSANNHLIGEAAGLFVAACTWPLWPETRRWLSAAAIMERETLRQNAEDGVNLEQAVSYQQFELDLVLLAMLAARAPGVRFGAAVEKRVEAMIEFVASIMDAGGHVPAIGDSDDGFVVKLSQEPDFCRYRSVLATGAVLFGRADFRARAGRLDDKTRWLLGKRADAAFAAPASEPRPSRRVFPDGGYYVLGCDVESQPEIRLVVDAGPLGYNTIAAHGHADALAFTLSVGGVEFLVDPGTYTYHPDGPWRAYFRSTGAHNTVRIDAQDQSEQGGSFMWLRKANAACSFWSSSPLQDVFEGWHDGYLRLADPVLHRRRIALDKNTRRIVIDDALTMTQEHDVELRFHCAESVSVRATSDQDGYELRCGSNKVLLCLPRAEKCSVRLLRGDYESPAGWISRGYARIEPTTTIVWRARLEGRRRLRSELHC